ncbi:hypothetical protein PL9214290072 [Planktothrix tepida PCC 9214]|uniref:Uncharacterized protein n=1 Tax=Planktothrix tepida PCC 9214 TaxID=671072 RepID=A0A1J1LEQ8_9CYAN|nr:hypothetical protein PL9214290072 [Planktothrix tepida PCC 9214]
MTEKAYESVTFGEAGTGVLEIPKVAIEGIWRFSEMSIGYDSEPLVTVAELDIVVAESGIVGSQEISTLALPVTS